MTTIVLGSSGRLGSAISLAFGRAGFPLLLHYFSRRENAEAVAARLAAEDRPKPTLCYADLTKRAEVEGLFAFTNDAVGPPRIVIHAAGATADSLLLKMKEEAFDRVIALNLSSAAWVLAAAAGRMREGAIILLGSHATSGREGQANYAASKAGLVALARSAARELSPSIRVNVVLPGYHPSPLSPSPLSPSPLSAASPQASERILRSAILKTSPTLEEVAQFILLLTQMRGVSGQIFALDSRAI